MAVESGSGEPVPRKKASRKRRLRRRARNTAARIALAVLGALVPAVLAPTRFLDGLRARRADPPSARRVVVLVQHAQGTGGTVRTVLTYAAYLARHHDVEVVGLVRESARPFFPFPPGVRVTWLDDRVEPPRGARGLVRAVLARVPSALVPVGEPSRGRCSLWTDALLVRRLRSLRGCVVIGTRPSLNLAAARFAGADVITVGQEHMNLAAHRPGVRAEILRRYPRLDALVTLTRADLESFRREVPGLARPHRIPNAVPALGGGRADPAARVVLAAGRLVPQKGFDLLLAAWERVEAAHPDWELRIFGAGRLQRSLTKKVAAHGLTRARLMGRTDAIGEEMGKASVYALSSRFEGLPMVLIEAMSKGMAVVAFDCPTGPAEVVADGADGLLVPAEDVAALARALDRAMTDEDLRRRLGERAVETARRYDLDAVGARWDELLDELVRARRTGGRTGSRTGGRPGGHSGE
ncbi:glycosyltransferase family 4 protein [Actinomadura atramentaria]|uniref:glycosyltransferase family 4 protein n=1 Tax=Actinomadura atramentaria TaxID=1990 RepID=UPI0003641397|nr:glycosyltransferase family 4 protein [Actinomadura atramentaria]